MPDGTDTQPANEGDKRRETMLAPNAFIQERQSLVSRGEQLRQIIERLDVLGEPHLLYQKVPEIREGYRRSTCGEHSIYYNINGENVEIMAILRSQDATMRFGRQKS